MVCKAFFVLSMAGALAAQGRTYLQAEIDGGARLYQANCTGCHGPEGDAIAGVNFGKGQLRRASTDDDLVRIIVRGIPGTPMPPSNFSEGQAGTIVAYVRSMAGSGAAAATSGDASRGKSLFEAKGQCLTCHSVAGSGARIGPPLTDIGAFRPSSELLRSLIEPSAEIRAENRSVRAVTRGGETITGRLLNQDTFSIQLIDAREQLRMLDKGSLREHEILKSSPMPSYRDKLTEQELADLVSYLSSLRGRS